MTSLLVAFDVDGTLLRGPSICACIAAGIGRTREMASLERHHSRAGIAAARATMAAWYRSLDAAVLRAPLKNLRLAPGAREGIALLRRAGAEVVLLSLSWQFALDWLVRERLPAHYALGAGLTKDGGVRHFWPEDKGRWLSGARRALGLRRGDVVAVGDSPSDRPMFFAAASGFYLGPEPPPHLPAHVRWRPDADIATLAQEILRGRRHAPCTPSVADRRPGRRARIMRPRAEFLVHS